MTGTIGQLLTWATGELSDSESARLDAELLLSYALRKDRSYLFTWPERIPSQEQTVQFSALIKKRQVGEPVAYLMGEQGFWTLNLSVTPATLIPRPETELLVELALAKAQLTNADAKPLTVLDLGTGSGAIALALAAEQPSWQITATDYSQAALAVASQNALRNGLKNVTFLHSDWFTNIQVPQKFDLIVSNPPYIDEHDEHLSQGDVRFEPSSALVAANCGRSDIENIARNATEFLKPNGRLLFEHGYNQGPWAVALLNELGYSNVQCNQDFGGRDRVTQGQWQ
ncbi:peptide chain release factor N(5)-glutamine methyltransferase [Halioxenophilus aromaticivorans]